MTFVIFMALLYVLDRDESNVGGIQVAKPISSWCSYLSANKQLKKHVDL